MTTSKEEISKYFDATGSRKIRDDLLFSVSIINEPKIAIDCGCGAGADIEYLLENRFTVHVMATNAGRSVHQGQRYKWTYHQSDI